MRIIIISNDNRRILVLPYNKHITDPKKLNVNKSNIKLGFRCLNRIIRVQKDKNNVEECSGVVYRIDCDSCNVSYIGQTGRFGLKNKRT